MIVLVCRLANFVGRCVRPHLEGTVIKRAMVIGTFHNEGWFEAHARPLALAKNIEEVLVVTDLPLSVSIDKVRFMCPSAWMTKLFGRELARFVKVLSSSYRYRPQLYMGYHIMPNAPLALISARIFGGKAAYQMTGGPIQILDGGYRSENRLLRATGTPSRRRERWLFELSRCFDLIVVRGGKALSFVKENSLGQACIEITGAIDTNAFCPSANVSKDTDFITVARLVPDKGIDKFIRAIRLVRDSRPSVSALIVGDGEWRQNLEALSGALGLDCSIRFVGQVRNVVPLLQRSRVFVLLSPSEGMSIAMLEAMSVGLPVVVNDVGDLRDAAGRVEENVLVSDDDVEAIAVILGKYLDGSIVPEAASKKARDVISDSFSVQSVALKWEQVLAEIASGRH